MRGAFISFLLTVCSVVSATNYYVKGGGNNSADGKSDATAWANISKVNSKSFLPGDSILFRKGDVWRETLIIPSSGSSGNHIIFSSYGTGNAPQIIGSVRPIAWTDQGGNIWKSSTTVANPSTNNGDLFFEQSDGTANWGTKKTSTSGLTTEYDWTWLSNNIYVYAATDPGSRYVSVEAPQRLYSISLNDKEYITINGLKLRYVQEAGISFKGTYPNMHLHGLIIKNCTISYIGNAATEDGFGIEAVYSDMSVENCIIFDSGRRNISLNMYGDGDVSNITVQNNTLYNGHHTTGIDLSQSGAGTIDNVIIRNNLIYDDLNRDAIASILIFIQSYSGPVQNVYIYSNIFKYPNFSAVQTEGVDKIYIYNNIFYGFNEPTTDAQHIYVSAGSTNITIKNNIFYSSQNKNFSSIYATVSTSQIIADYNLYYRINNSLKIINNGTSYYMNSAFPISAGWEAHGVKANPAFISTTDYHLQPGSPAIGAGIAIPLVTTDFEGNTYMNPPNIGCYATPIPTSNPVFLDAIIANATPSLLEISFNKTLTNIIPATSAFTVLVNSVSRTINSITISGAKVQLTLASPVVFGDVVTVSYTKPATNPLQMSTGEQAVSFSSKVVTNGISAPVPSYVSSVIENATPSLLAVTFNMNLANIIPATNAFSVLVNSVNRVVSTVTISSTAVRLTLASPVAYGDVVTVAYTKPALNPLQTSSGGLVATFSFKTVVNNVNPAVPVYVSSVVENATPTLLEVTFDLTLANIIPSTTSFTVVVNSVNRTVSTVTISGTIVRLTLASPVAFGDIITVAYTKPATNPLQSSAGGQAITISAKTVTNNVNPSIPTYVSSVIEDAAPTFLVMTYSAALANITPATTAFSVTVNSAARTINSVVITGNKVQLTLVNAVIYGDNVTVAYTKPALNPLQTSAGGQAATISGSTVTNNISPASPIYISSVIDNSNPTLLEMTYQLTLADITPGVSAFTVTANAASVTINSVSISGTKVKLILASPVTYGDIVTVAYTKPAVNPLQTSAGAQAANLSATQVTNNVNPAIPVYISSRIDDASPSVLALLFSDVLVNSSPAVSAFSVLVNSTTRPVSSVVVSGTLVTLNLESAVLNGDVVTIAYTKPAANFLHTLTGGQVASFTAKPVSNNVGVVNIPPIIITVYSDTCLSGFVGEIDASGSNDINNDILSFSWTSPDGIDISSATDSKINFLVPIVSITETDTLILSVSDGKSTQTENIPITIVPYKPELSLSFITYVTSSSYSGTDYPENAKDENIETFWSSTGDNQWIMCKLRDPFRIDHFKLSFPKEGIGASFFDILASKDSLSWDPLITNATSCGFSNNLQTFIPQESDLKSYSFIKLVGHGNSLNSLNKVSELNVYGGTVYPNSDIIEIGMTVYPNPAREIINIFFRKTLQDSQIIKVANMSGKVEYETSLETGLNYLQIPVTFPTGFYIIHLISNGRIRAASKLLIQR